jgi:glucosylglycerate phosphorylase
VNEATLARVHAHLRRIYDAPTADATAARLLTLVSEFAARHPGLGRRGRELFDQTDVMLIAYPDQVRQPGEAPLVTLRRFLDAHVRDTVTGLHLLPPHPASSDDGFAVVDYGSVDPAFGDWADVTALATGRRLMLDAVVNHTSASHRWFLRSQCGDPDYTGFYHYPDPAADLRSVIRPRRTPLLTPMWSADERRRWAWTTFGPDQVDLNYADPRVLLAVTEVLLSYLARGAGALRLDAVAFLWKRPGTSCLHLPETHEIIRLWRTIVDAVAPGTLLVTETNVPHAENVSYFGDGTDQAHLVYQFPLPSLVLAAFGARDAGALRQWAATVADPGPLATYLTFLASHDGVGLRPVEGLLPDAQVARLCAAVADHGGRVSHRTGADGAVRPYELNTTYLDALDAVAGTSGEPRGRCVRRLLAAHAILLSQAGVPAVYVHSLLGSRNWVAGVDHTGRARVINRQRLARAGLEADLADPLSTRHQVLHGLRRLIAVRAGQPAFHPNAAQAVVGGGSRRYVAVQRTAVAGDSTVLCVHDVSGRAGRFRARPPDRLPPGGRVVDLVDGDEHRVEADGTVEVPVPAYGVRWLRAH